MGLDGRSQRTFPKPWTGLAAIGNSQATAFLLDNGVYHEFSTVGSGQGCVLPVPVELPREITISNNGGSALLVYPQAGGTIDNGSANASVSVATGSSVTYWPTSFTNWQSRVTGGSGGGGGSTTITEVSHTTSFTAAANSFYAISGSSAVTATLPTAVGIAGQTVRVRCVGGYTGLCTITGTGGQTVGGAASQIIYAGESPLLQSDGANWVRTAGTIIPARAAMTLSTNQSIAGSNTHTPVAFDTKAFDNTNLMVNTGASSITLLRAGDYNVNLTLYTFNGAGGQGFATVQVNGADLYVGGGSIQAAAAAPIFLAKTIAFSAGDVLTADASLASSGDLLGGSTGSAISYFEVTEIPSW